MSDQVSNNPAPEETAKTESPKPARRTVGLTCKVSEKGAVSVYGLGRFPVTLYREQWERLLAASEEIRKFIGENQDKLKVKE